MKKILALLGAFGLVSTSASTVVACNDVASLTFYSDKIENEIRTEVFKYKNNGIDMREYFNGSGYLFVNGIQKDNGKDNPLPLTVDFFKEAVRSAVNFVIKNSDKDCKISFSRYLGSEENVSKINSNDWKEFTLEQKNGWIKIDINAEKDSKLWKDKATIYIQTKEKDENKLNEGVGQ